MQRLLQIREKVIYCLHQGPPSIHIEYTPILLRISLSCIHIFSRIITQQGGTEFIREVAILKQCYTKEKYEICPVCI